MFVLPVIGHAVQVRVRRYVVRRERVLGIAADLVGIANNAVAGGHLAGAHHLDHTSIYGIAPRPRGTGLGQHLAKGLQGRLKVMAAQFLGRLKELIECPYLLVA